MARAKLGRPTDEGKDRELGYKDELKATDINSASNKGMLEDTKFKPSELLASEGSK